jgi:hypothetical protein
LNGACYSVHVNRTLQQERTAAADLAQVLAALPFTWDVALAPAPDGRADVVVTHPNGDRLVFEVRALKAVTPADAARVASAERWRDVYPVLVADQVTPQAGTMLAEAGWGWLDRRGHLLLIAGQLAVDKDIEPLKANEDAQPARPTLETSVGLDVAAAVLTAPEEKLSVRRLVAFTGRSLGAVHQAVRGLAGEGLVDGRGIPLAQELFWEAADRWRPQRMSLTEMPALGDASRTDQLQLGLDDIEGKPGWALTDAVAANIFGAPMPVRGDDPPDFYVPDARTVRVALHLYGAAPRFEARAATVAVAPATWVCQRRVDPVTAGRDHRLQHFGAAHPLVVAFDLASDAGRGREVLEQWVPPEPYHRVW